MEQKKSTLKEIKATVMPQTAEGLQMLMINKLNCSS